MTVKTVEEKEQIHAQINQQIKTIFKIEDMRGLLIFSALGRLSQLAEMCDSLSSEGQEISAPRWRVLLHLFMGEQRGRKDGITPTELSHFQRVSKNTVSSLLRGLEEQGLVMRDMDREDLRVFRIHLTPAGRELIMKTAPARIARLNEMLDELPNEDKDQLVILLNKLSRILQAQAEICQREQQRN